MLKLTILAVAFGMLQAGSQLYMPNANYELPGVKVSAEFIQATANRTAIENRDDIPIRMVDAGGAEGGHQVGVSLVSRYRGFTNGGAAHDKVSEVYYVIEGDGVMQLGGQLRDAFRRPTSGGNGPGMSGSGIDGGQKIHLGPGDMLIIPAGTPHRWEVVNERMVYTVTRIDPEIVTPLL